MRSAHKRTGRLPPIDMKAAYRLATPLLPSINRMDADNSHAVDADERTPDNITLISPQDMTWRRVQDDEARG